LKRKLNLFFVLSILNCLIGFGELISKEKDIGNKDILLDDNPTYSADRKGSERQEKIREEYEDTEFEIPARKIPLKTRNLVPDDSNETLAKFESRQETVPGKKKDNEAMLYGGTGNFIGGYLDFRKMINHGQPDKDFSFSMFSIRAKDETYDYFESRGKYVLDSAMTQNNYELKGLTYLNENVKISYNIARRNSILYLQNNLYFKKQKKILNSADVRIDFVQSDKVFHRAEFKSYGFQLEYESRNLPVSNGELDKKSKLGKNSAEVESQFDLTENWKIFSILNYSFYSGDSFQIGKYPGNKETLLRSDGRFRAGLAKKEEGDLFRGWIFKSFWNIHYISSEKNLYGGEIYLGYRYKDFLFAGNYQKSGKILDYYETYVQNDLGEMNLDFKRTIVSKTFFSVAYETPKLLRVALKVGDAYEYGKYIFERTRDYLYHPGQVDVGYGFYDVEINIPVKKSIQVGGEISYRNYDQNNLPYLPRIIQTAYFRFMQEKYSLELKSFYMSNMNMNGNGKKLPHQRRFDFLFYYAIFGKLDFRLEIRNLEDRELYYREDFYFPGRQILFGIRMNF